MGRLLLWVFLTGLLAVPAHAADEDEPSAAAMAADALIARPLGIVATTLGAAIFVVSLPFSAAGGNIEGAADALVVGPARETFVRCLGCRSAGRYQKPRNG
jgi:hypothetical protein